MTLDHMDIYSSPPAIEQVAEAPASSTEGIIDRVNAGLPSSVRIELPKTREEKERAVYELVIVRLKSRIESGEYKEGITVRYIRDGVYSMRSNQTGNVSAYLNERGEVLFGVKPLKERRRVANGKVYSDLGLVEKKVGTRYEMYRVIGDVTKDGKKEPMLEEPIDQESEEGYEMWRDIMFHSDVIENISLLKTPVEVTEKWLRFTIEEGSLRFQDLEPFRTRGIIPNEELYQYALGELRKILPQQCDPLNPISRRLGDYGDLYTIKDGRDTRTMAIRESDLKMYVERGYIDADLAMRCFQLLPKGQRDLSER